MKPEPTATEAAAYVGTKIAEWAAYGIIVYCICKAWVILP